MSIHFSVDNEDYWAIIYYMSKNKQKTGTGSMNGISNPRREKAQNAQYSISSKEKKEWKKLYGWEPPSRRKKKRRKK